MVALMTLYPWSSATGTGVAVGLGARVGVGVVAGTTIRIGLGLGVGTEVAVGTNVGVFVGLGGRVAVGGLVAAGTGVGWPAFSSLNLDSTVASTARSWASLASTVASISGVGSTALTTLISGIGLAGAGATVEQASPSIPISTARTNGSFIPFTLQLPVHPRQSSHYCLPQAP